MPIRIDKMLLLFTLFLWYVWPPYTKPNCINYTAVIFNFHSLFDMALVTSILEDILSIMNNMSNLPRKLLCFLVFYESLQHLDKLFPRATELAFQDKMKTMSWTYWQLTILFPVNFQSLHLSFSPSPSFSSLTPSLLWLVFLPPLVLSPARPKETTTSTCYQRVKKTNDKKQAHWKGNIEKYFLWFIRL